MFVLNVCTFECIVSIIKYKHKSIFKFVSVENKIILLYYMKEYKDILSFVVFIHIIITVISKNNMSMCVSVCVEWIFIMSVVITHLTRL